MRQAGILAAAGLYALKNNVARLQEDHDNAAWMAEQLREAGADVMRHDTNMLFVRVGEEHAAALGEYMKAQGVLINASPIVRLVMHLDVSREQLAEVVAHWRTFNPIRRWACRNGFGSWRQWLHWSAFGTGAQSARASGVGCGTSH